MQHFCSHRNTAKRGPPTGTTPAAPAAAAAAFAAAAAAAATTTTTVWLPAAIMIPRPPPPPLQCGGLSLWTTRPSPQTSPASPLPPPTPAVPSRPGRQPPPRLLSLAGPVSSELSELVSESHAFRLSSSPPARPGPAASGQRIAEGIPKLSSQPPPPPASESSPRPPSPSAPTRRRRRWRRRPGRLRRAPRPRRSLRRNQAPESATLLPRPGSGA